LIQAEKITVQTWNNNKWQFLGQRKEYEVFSTNQSFPLQGILWSVAILLLISFGNFSAKFDSILKL
jgi:hypothetical protein